jgi:hypothetical protein
MAINLSKTNPFRNFKINPQDAKYSINFYKNSVKTLADGIKKDAPGFMDIAGAGTLESGLTPGSLYLYSYDPKWKAVLPIYDTFPLVFPFRKMGDRFLGFNLHYLPVAARVAMMGTLMEYINTPTLTTTSRIRVSYEMLNHFAKLEPLRETIHMYLFSHVRSRFLKIDADNWTTVARLPLENFVRKQK